MRRWIVVLAVMVVLAVVEPVHGSIIVAGDNSNITLNDGAYADGTEASVPSSFSKELFAFNGATGEGQLPLSDMPVSTVGGILYFYFVLDQQEPGGNQESLTISDIDISVTPSGTTTPIPIWNLYDTLDLNLTGQVATNSPQGDGGDMGLYVPVSLFYGHNFTGADTLSFKTTQVNYGDGPEEWVTVGAGFFVPDVPIDPEDPDVPSLPEPASLVVWLLLGALGATVGWGRRRKRAP